MRQDAQTKAAALIKDYGLITDDQEAEEAARSLLALCVACVEVICDEENDYGEVI